MPVTRGSQSQRGTAAPVGLALACALGCALEQRASERFVDPGLRESGLALEGRHRRGGYPLGPFTISSIQVTEVTPTTDGPLGEIARPTVQHASSFTLTREGARPWLVDCITQRRQSTDADYAAVTDESHDELGMECRLGNPTEAWRFRVHGDLSGNLRGALWPESSPDDALSVEILLWFDLMRGFPRRIPAPVAQVLMPPRVAGAAFLTAPERMWLNRDLPPTTSDAIASTLTALRLIPLGWE